jgi:hypothetical protein
MPRRLSRELVAALIGALAKRRRRRCACSGCVVARRPRRWLGWQRERPSPALVVLPRAPEAEAFAADLRFFMGDGVGDGPLQRRVHYLPAWEVPPFERLSPDARCSRRVRRASTTCCETTNPVS